MVLILIIITLLHPEEGPSCRKTSSTFAYRSCAATMSRNVRMLANHSSHFQDPPNLFQSYYRISFPPKPLGLRGEVPFDKEAQKLRSLLELFHARVLQLA